ncbi:hypothetical protein FPV58_12980 [Mycolicibacterium porcinum]|uniref:hypothetical protein n=1 Tax=Mycolicibacterium porcinum TaxID=39693 RepID=UPI00119279C2|nr:hypothetical protein [Mycolicibacterium porcinum]TVY01525.1 hypothetical protein FPV58_12980 [Mycolicibacterium porcinum]
MKTLAYGQHLVAFFDILGFSELVSRDVPDDEARKTIEMFNEALLGVRSRFAERWSWETGEFAVKMFSDCICVSVAADPINLDAFFQQIAYLQSWMCLQAGIALRGAVTVGRHYINDQMIFSEALVEAYKLEQNKATPPCIVVSDRLRGYILENYKNSDIEHINAAHFQHGYVMKDDQSGRLFLDYLNFMPASDDNGEKIRAHRAWIIENLATYEKVPSVGVKYEWLRDYHNSWCNIFESHREDLSELLIDVPNRRFSFRTDIGLLE